MGVVVGTEVCVVADVVEAKVEVTVAFESIVVATSGIALVLLASSNSSSSSSSSSYNKSSKFGEQLEY